MKPYLEQSLGNTRETVIGQVNVSQSRQLVQIGGKVIEPPTRVRQMQHFELTQDGHGPQLSSVHRIMTEDESLKAGEASQLGGKAGHLVVGHIKKHKVGARHKKVGWDVCDVIVTQVEN